jgi:ribonuclease HI
MVLITMTVDYRENARKNILIYTNVMSVIKTLSTKRNSGMNKLQKSLTNMTKRYKNAVNQWIPSHCNIAGNEEADQLAKDGG